MDIVSKHLIYALVDPRTKEWRYIGKSSRGVKRAQEHSMPSHLNQTARTYRSHWIKSLKSLGLECEIVVLEEFENSEKLSEAEIEWIAEARRVGVRLTNLTDGVRLTNLTDGGDGAGGNVWSLESRVKQSNLKKGKRCSKETRAKMCRVATALRGKPITDNFGNMWPSIEACSTELGVDDSNISAVLHGRKTKFRGRTFKFMENC